ncbi:MAG: ABC transporter permease subunit [Phycisphaerae bacterium]
MTVKRFAFILAALGVIVLLSSWDNVAEWTEATLRQESVRPKKVAFWTSSGSPAVELKRARQFMQENPDIFVKPNFRESGGFNDILFVSFLSGSPPDYMTVQAGDIREMVVTGRIRPIDDLIAQQLERDPEFFEKDFLGRDRIYRFTVNPNDRYLREMDKYPLEAARLLEMNGKAVGLRGLTSLSSLTINKRLFREAHEWFKTHPPKVEPRIQLIDEASGEAIYPKTWYEFYEAARLLSLYGREKAEELGQTDPVCYGVVLQGQRPRDLMRGIRPLAARAGSIGFNFKGKKWLEMEKYAGQEVGYYEYHDPAFITSFSLLLKMKANGWVLPGTESRHYEDVRTELASGSAAMLIDGWHAALIGAERAPWAAQDLGSAQIPEPYTNAEEKRWLEKELELTELGIELPEGTVMPRPAGENVDIITSLCRFPQATWKWMQYAQTAEEVLKAECRRGTVPEQYSAYKHIDDPEWFPYDYQPEVYDIIRNKCQIWPEKPAHGPVKGNTNEDIFHKYFYTHSGDSIAETIALAGEDVAGFSERANANLAERVKNGVTAPEFWTFENWKPAKGPQFARAQQTLSEQEKFKEGLAEAEDRLDTIAPGLQMREDLYKYEDPGSRWQLLWIPGLMAGVVLAWMAVMAMKGKRRNQPLLGRKLGEAKRSWEGYAFVFPGMLALFAFALWPSIYQFWLSIHSGSGLAPMRYVGAENFERILFFWEDGWDSDFWYKVLPNTALYMIIVTFGQIAIGLIFASMLNLGLRANRFYRVLYFIPLVTSLAIVSVIFIGLLKGPDSGLNAVLDAIGLKTEIPFWLGLTDSPGKAYDWLGPKTDLWLIMVVGIWHGLPYNIILLLAGLQSIDPQLYEAGKVDGANAQQRFMHITIPELMPILIVITFNALVGAARAFSVAYVLTEGGVDRSSELVSTYIFKWGFTRPEGMEADLGYASALGIVYAVMLAAFSFANVYIIARRWKRRLSRPIPAGGATGQGGAANA